jgi:hypothetical protein
VDAAAVDYLAAGDTKVESFTFTLCDGHGGGVARTVDVTITGTNDRPVITSAPQAASVTEMAERAAGEDASNHMPPRWDLKAAQGLLPGREQSSGRL